MSVEAIPDYGDLMTLEEFSESCLSGLFTDYDGHGNYATATEMSDKVVYPSDIIYGHIPMQKWTHVVWFNK